MKCSPLLTEPRRLPQDQIGRRPDTGRHGEDRQGQRASGPWAGSVPGGPAPADQRRGQHREHRGANEMGQTAERVREAGQRDEFGSGHGWQSIPRRTAHTLHPKWGSRRRGITRSGNFPYLQRRVARRWDRRARVVHSFVGRAPALPLARR
jgi:hypothetical protein